jgi:hypothetical protein
MTISDKLPPIIGPIMIPIFVDLGLDIGDSKNRFPGVYTKVQVPLFGMKYGGIGPLKLLFCTNLFHIVESSMSQLV